MTSPPRSVIKDRCIGALNAWGRVMSSTPEPKDPEMVGGGVFGWEPGEWTDDTQMALCIAHVTAEGSTDPMAIGKQLLDWYRRQPKDAGVLTAEVLSSANSAADPQALAAERFAKVAVGSYGGQRTWDHTGDLWGRWIGLRNYS